MLILTIKFPKVTTSVIQTSLFVQLLYYHHPKICLFLFRAGNSSCDFPNSCSRVAAVWGVWGKYPIGAHLFILRSPQNAIAFSLLQYKNAFMSWGFTGRMRCQNSANYSCAGVRETAPEERVACLGGKHITLKGFPFFCLWLTNTRGLYACSSF